MHPTRRSRRTLSLTRAALAATWVAVMATAPTTTFASEVSFDKVPVSYAAMMKMKPMDVMHLMDPDKKGYVTKDDFMKFQEQLFNTWDKDKNGRLAAPVFTDEG